MSVAFRPRRTVPDARLRLLARRLHRLGERPLYEYLRELSNGADLLERLERYAQLDRDFIAAAGGDKLPSPARLVASNREANGPDGQP
ncbi:MAG: hypothetical protein ACLQLT_12270 [Methylovirgula sp.]